MNARTPRNGVAGPWRRYLPRRRWLAAGVIDCIVLPWLASTAAPIAQFAATGAPPGAEPAALPVDSIRIGGLERSFRYYRPAGLVAGAPLVLVFHGSGGDGARIRGFIGAPLEALASERGFVVAYPDGFEGHWNDCRRLAPFSANTRDVPDLEFIDGLIRWFGGRHAIDTLRVGAIGFSNGGHFAYRLALEMPRRVAAVAAVGASLPVDNEMECTPRERPAAVMIVNGTADTINPYAGGEVIAPGDVRLGTVRSTPQTARYLAGLAGVTDKPRRRPITTPGGAHDTWVECAEWVRPDSPGIVLFTIHGGGHTVPGPDTALPDWLGPTARRFDALKAAIDWFDSQPLSLENGRDRPLRAPRAPPAP